MSNAWETTTDDVENVLRNNGIEDHEMNEEKIEELIDFRLDHDGIEKEALRGEDMDEQTTFAYAEIKRQLGLGQNFNW